MQNVRPVLKALGDETRYRVYAWLREVDRPVTIGEIAERFDLHPNTVRPHLDQLRDAGLVEMDATPQGSVGRPQHRFTAVPADIELHRASDEDAHVLLTRMLADLCCRAKVANREAVAIGRSVGGRLPAGYTSVAEAVDTEMEQLGFAPATDEGTVTFTSCPFRELAQAYPGLVCSLHEGLVAGVVNDLGGQLIDFHGLESSTPCMASFSETGGTE